MEVVRVERLASTEIDQRRLAWRVAARRFAARHARERSLQGRGMYCPKCGTPMERRGNELTCVAGNMGLSAALEQSLVAHFGVDSPVRAVPPLSFRVGGQWFCPKDGTPMREADGMVQCPRCARCFTGSQIYQLIEVHPHRSR